MTTFFVFKGKGGNNVNKNRSNLVLSLVSLVITSFLLVFTVYSWYTSNQEVKASSIVGATEINNSEFTLEKWSSSANEWVGVSKIEEENVLPGTVLYLRLKCVNANDTAISLNAKFEGISSVLNTSYVKVSGTNITYNGVPTYTIANNQVTVGASNNVLYDVSNTTISLNKFKIEDGYVIQCFGTTETKTGAISSIDDATDDLKTIDESILSAQEFASGTSYYYFALTYLDNDDLNNYYMYQSLIIESLTITESE